MNDAQWLALILAGVYTAECVVRVPSGALVLRPSSGTRRVARVASWSDVLQGGLVLDTALPPLDGHAVLQPWPIAISPEGVVARGAADGAAAPHFVAWDRTADVAADGRDLVVDGVAVARCASPAAATSLGESLAKIAAVPGESREQAIVAAIDARFDAAAVTARRDEWTRASSRVRVSANVLFVVAAALVLGMAGTQFLTAIWPWLLIPAAFAVVWTLRDFSYAFRQLHPGSDADRRRAVLHLAMSPLAAIRAASVAGRDVYAPWDPLTVAAVTCDDDAFRDFARTTLCELRHPLAAAGERAADVARCEDWFRARLVERAERFLRTKDVDPSALLAPPAKTNAASRAFCPRCRTQYEIVAGACADCAGVALVAFAADGATTEPARPA